ncbi:hypothetical protein DH2020_001819 [Rehmannia glutinosa]|uniref:Pectinesterase inhibitor domain-containing protein n=1 Tax=Rehmannia glutinosa TaxID=99300 RepID=A0ABR0XSA8_REHGL
MKPSLISIFLIFLILLKKSQANKTHKIVTDALIHKICPQTKNPPFCMYIMNQFKGKPLLPTPFAGVMGMAQNQAKTTKEKILGLHNGIKDDKSELKLRYHKCLEKYTNAMNQLNEANRFMNSANIRSVKHYTSLAMSGVQSCDKEFAKSHEPSNLSKDNRKFQDLCSVTLAICDQVLPGRH